MIIGGKLENFERRLFMLGIIVPILITYYVYKNAKENGRNAVLWAVINVAVILAIQLGIGIGAGIVIGLGIELWGWSPNLLDIYALPITLISVVLSLLASYLVYRHVTRVPDAQFNQPLPPPPPSNFN